jgi:glutathione S-transferase
MYPAMSLTLVIGNKNYSSWSLRPWFYLKYHDIAFDEVRIPLYREDSRPAILSYSPSGKVPVLMDDAMLVWDSLAILEYLAETRAYTQGWPMRLEDRAMARCLAAEIHSGFQHLRNHCGMNCRRQPKAKALPAEVHQDIARVRQIWQACRATSAEQGPWLFGEFGIVDAMYAPVALRFHQYALEAGAVEQAYIDTVLGHPAMQEWISAGQAETEIIPQFED